MPGQRVIIPEPATLNWKLAEIKERKLAEIKERLNGVPLSYVVTTSTGRGLRHKRAHIREAHQDTVLGQTQMSSLPPMILLAYLLPLLNTTEPPPPHIPDLPCSQAVTLPASYTTRSSRVIDPPLRMDF